MQHGMDYDFLIKTIIIGDSGVGKSSILSAYCDDTFSDSYISTIGVDFKIKSIKIDNYNVKLQIWDTAGQERYHSITKSYYRSANAVFLVFDLTNLQSFRKLNDWYNDLSQNIPQNNFKIILVGSKSDMVNSINVSKDDIDNFIKKYDMEYVEVSSKCRKNINIAFESLISKVVKEKEVSYHFTESNHRNIKQNRKCCNT